MDELSSCQEQLERLDARIREYQKQLKESQSAQERGTLRGKITACRAARRDIKVQLDHLQPPKPKAKKPPRKRLNTDGLSFDYFERNKIRFSDLEGRSWSQIEAGQLVDVSEEAATLRRWLAQGATRLTERQTLYIDAYYNRGLSQDKIAEEFGTSRTTVCKVIKAGLRRLEEWVGANQLVQKCISEQGRFDWCRCLSEMSVLTDRQRELALLTLSRCPKSREELAQKLELERSTVVRTLIRVRKTLEHLEIPNAKPTRHFPLQGWEHADKFSLALQTGMPLNFYYRYCFRGQRIAGLTRYMYEMALRQASGADVEEVAQELGMTTRAVRNAFYRLRRAGVQIGHIPRSEDDRIGNRLDPDTYLRLQRMVTARADS